MASRTDELSSALSRQGENPVKRWFLLTGARLSIMFALMVGVFVVLLGLSLIKPVGMQDLLNETNAAITLFSSLLGGAILLVSIVVSINSIVLTQEMTDLEKQENRIDASLEYHRRIEEFIDTDITPARPAHFLSAVLYAISRQVQTLIELAAESENDEFREDINEFADQIAEDIELARQTLTDAQFGSFKVLQAGLNYNYSGQLHASRGLTRKYNGQLGDEEQEALENLVDTLKYIGTGREYFKSLYFKREFARLSSRLLYVALPVIVFTSYVILALDANLFPEISFFGLSPLLLSVIFAYTVALAPYLILTAYIMRATTIALRTLASGPFILRKGSDIDTLGWGAPDPAREWELAERSDD